ncbi:signal peptide peptidase SppA [Magnetospirillum fulvum]|uniref:Signal peptide peptidase A. Serine peptidase. MEROPS family S49 n=1 Tax=Magnetospirillum fulvum TaxID=1082 RepID=A0A1H6JP58_MAGFU|nr:signal peptide peptidase SppA [Magnetospirillum fulvum]SEH64236.1 signal peptide peptidase A. Serine peptidase. MEROPS family S49 [Magnetospirillum fulvum]
MRRLGRLLVILLAVTGFLTLCGIGLTGLVAYRLATGEGVTVPPERGIVTLDLESRFRSAPNGDPMAALSGEQSYVLRQVIEAIDAAAADRRVVGLFATMGHASLGLADGQDLRDAIIRFRASGKPAVLFAETLGDGGVGTLDYYLASAFGQVWLQPSGDVGLTGLAAESPFVKGTLDLLGIKTQFFARHEYKSAIETFTQSAYSAPHRETLGRLLDSWTGQIVAGIASGRKMPVERVQGLLGKGPYLPPEALAAGLIDRVGYRDEAWTAVAGSGESAAEEVDIADYAARQISPNGVKVALISGLGAIHRGESSPGFDDDGGFGAATIAQAFRDAVEDESVKAILFRVDSPGGSYTASDTIWHEVKLARAAGKPVVVSMGNVAASGGYFVAMGADRVLAQPGTLTGSIGVFTGKVVLDEFWRKLGVSWDEMHRGDNAGMWSMNRPFPPEAQARIDAMLDAIYADFTGKAVEGRAIPADKIDQLARGRVWSGTDAHDNGLVDGLGGWHEAIAAVRDLAHLKPEDSLNLVAFPEPRKPWEVLAEALSGGSVAERKALSRAVAVLDPLLAPLAALPVPRDGGGASLRMMPVSPAGAAR